MAMPWCARSPRRLFWRELWQAEAPPARHRRQSSGPSPPVSASPPPPPYVATLSHVQAHLEMASEVPLHSSHFGVFPPALLALARRHSVMQLELSLTRGRWVSRAPP